MERDTTALANIFVDIINTLGINLAFNLMLGPVYTKSQYERKVSFKTMEINRIAPE